MLASQIRRGAWKGRDCWWTLKAFVRAVPELTWNAITELSGKVSGCGCTDDEAEVCGTSDWCYCPCHPENAEKRSPCRCGEPQTAHDPSGIPGVCDGYDPQTDKHLACDQCGENPLVEYNAKAGDRCPRHALPDPRSSCNGMLRVTGCGDPECCR